MISSQSGRAKQETIEVIGAHSYLQGNGGVMRSVLALAAMLLSASLDLPAKPSGGGNGNSGSSDRASASDSHESGEGSYANGESGSTGASASASAAHSGGNSGTAAHGS